MPRVIQVVGVSPCNDLDRRRFEIDTTVPGVRSELTKALAQ